MSLAENSGVPNPLLSVLIGALLLLGLLTLCLCLLARGRWLPAGLGWTMVLLAAVDASGRWPPAWIEALRGGAVLWLAAGIMLLALSAMLAAADIRARMQLGAHRQAEQAAAVERERIAADLHDDLGAKLLTIVHTSHSDRIAVMGREALEEMRLSVRGLTTGSVDINDALADWRSEAISRLEPAAIELDWPLDAPLPQVRVGARSLVQATRILREALSNVIRHSRASRCVVQASCQGQRLQLTIADNGIGFDPIAAASAAGGLGLANMQQRARHQQGQCLIDSRPGQGCRVALSLPLERPPMGKGRHSSTA